MNVSVLIRTMHGSGHMTLNTNTAALVVAAECHIWCFFIFLSTLRLYDLYLHVMYFLTADTSESTKKIIWKISDTLSMVKGSKVSKNKKFLEKWIYSASSACVSMMTYGHISTYSDWHLDVVMWKTDIRKVSHRGMLWPISGSMCACPVPFLSLIMHA